MPLQRETVARAALRLVDEVGLDGLTTRRLATYLDIQSPSLYWHFTNKQELVNCMAEVMVADALADLHPPETNQDWATWLAEYARLVRRMELSHRDGARIVAEADLTLGSFGSSADLAVRVLHDAGFAPQSALVCVVTMVNYVLGNAFEIQAEPSHTPLDGGSRRSVPLQSPVIDPKRFPTLAHFVDESSIPLAAHEEWFEEGLRLLLNGMRVALVQETEH
jgi:TetR/AcrR family tetracycline transcriptional repressor